MSEDRCIHDMLFAECGFCDPAVARGSASDAAAPAPGNDPAGTLPAGGDPAAKRRGVGPAITALGVVVCVAAVGFAVYAQVRPGEEPVTVRDNVRSGLRPETVAPVDTAATAECATVERAYRAWFWEPVSSADWHQFRLRPRIEDGDEFRAAVDGYLDQPALELTTAILTYNYELALVNFRFTAEGGADTSAAETARDRVVESYEAFARTTCSLAE